MPNHAICDDGVFCNGQENCGAGSGCGAGKPPCESYLCDENANACRAGVPTVSTWGLLTLCLLLLVAAKIRFSTHEAN